MRNISSSVMKIVNTILILSLIYVNTAIMLIHARLDCDFENSTCDWTLITDKSLHRSPRFKEHNICGFHGAASLCKWLFDGDIGKNFNWMIGTMSEITNQILENAKNSKSELNTRQLQNTLSKGFDENDTIVFTHNLDYMRLTPIRLNWTTSYMISDELPFSYHPSCLHYRYFLSGLTSVVVSYLTNFNNVYDDVPISAHTSENRREKLLSSSVNLPAQANFKIIFRSILSTTIFSSAAIDSIKVTTGRCSEICSADEFRCDREQCINSGLLCDGKADCIDASDEYFCCKNHMNIANIEHDIAEMMFCNDTEHVIREETALRIMDNVAKSMNRNLHHISLSNNTPCKFHCESENIQQEIRDTSSVELQGFTGKELNLLENDIGITKDSSCTPFCPSTCRCLGRSMKCVDRDCSVLVRIITLHNVNCDVIDVDRFDSRHIFTLYISNSVIGNLSINPKNKRVMLHNLYMEDTAVEHILIGESSHEVEYLHSIQLQNCTIGSFIKESEIGGHHMVHIYRKSALEFHINSLIMNFSTEIVIASVNFPHDITLGLIFDDMVNLSKCELTDGAEIIYSYFPTKVVDFSHNFLTRYTYRPRLMTALYIQHNLLSTMIISAYPDMNEYDGLEIIDISYNRITHLRQGELFFTKLIYLNLKGNLIHTIDAGAFSETTNLVFLDLSRNKISRIITGTFLPLEFLQELYIQENEFQVSDGMFDGLRRLALMQVEFFSLCCTKPKTFDVLKCIAPVSEISSCENLIDVSLLSVTIWYMAFLSTFGNFIVFTYNVHYLKTMSPDKYTVLIVNLSLADFLMGVYLNILAMMNQMYTGRYGLADYTWRHSVTCTVSGIIATLSSEASVMMVFLITLDRFIAVKYPFSKLLFSVKTASILSCVAWVFSLLLSLIPLLPVPGFEDFYAQSGICISLPLSVVRKSGWEYSMIIFVGFNFLLFLGILVGQISVFVEVLQSGRNVRSSRSMQREKALAVTVLGVVLTDILCWIPIGTIGMLTFFGVSIASDVYAWIIVVVLPINSALNPLLYTLTTVIRRMRRRESDRVSQLKQQLAYWKTKHGYPSDVTLPEIQERNRTQDCPQNSGMVNT